MVAKIVIGKSIRGILHYNENKVAEGQARLILASGFATDVESLSFNNKLRRFEHLTELRPSVRTNALHITLNFDATEKIDNDKMQQIAMAYMEKIGFGEQPYLVYRHNDVAHQHLHIATISIKRNGKPIDLHHIGRDISEPARKAIEREFDLVVAENKKFKPEPAIKPADYEAIKYGHIPTKRAVGNIVTALMNSYRFTSLAEYNAVLKQFNVIADRGKEESEMFQHKGLIYFLLDKQGNKVGVPIKSSSFYSKPTLRNLEKKFLANEERRKPHKADLTSRIDKVLGRYECITRDTMLTTLQKSGISLVLRQNDQGYIFGATFVDHLNKVVFNGSDLGKGYSAKAITERLGNRDQLKTYLKPVISNRSYLKTEVEKRENAYLENTQTTNYLTDLLGRSPADDKPIALQKKRKRRKGHILK